MGIIEAVNSALDVVLRPALEGLSPFWFVTLIALVIAIISVLAYKFFTDQKAMKAHREDMKAMQKKAKELKSDPTKMMALNKEMMEKNMSMMMQTFKVSFITIIPILLLYGYLHAHLEYERINPQEEFSVTIALADAFEGNITVSTGTGLETVDGGQQTAESGKVFHFKGSEGLHPITFTANNKEYTHEVLISTTKDYLPRQQELNDATIKTITTDLEPVNIINILGLHLNWFWSYIILTIIFSMALRKLLKVY